MFPLTVAFKPGIICLAFMLCQLSASCQQRDWAQAITDSGVSAGAGHSIAVDKNNDLYVSSAEVLAYELAVVFISKYDTSRNLIWKRSAQTASGSGKVAVDKAGNVFFSGMFCQAEALAGIGAAP